MVVVIPAQAHQFELLNMKANAQPYGAVLPKAKTPTLTPPRSYAKIGLASGFDQVPVIFWSYWFRATPEVFRVGVPIGEQVRHDQILVSPDARQ